MGSSLLPTAPTRDHYSGYMRTILRRKRYLIAHFDWCSDIRNKLLHSELYPALFGGQPDLLYLTKPTSKNDSKASYLRRQRMALDLALKRSKMLFAGIMG
jgi:hypothetical protein